MSVAVDLFFMFSAKLESAEDKVAFVANFNREMMTRITPETFEFGDAFIYSVEELDGKSVADALKELGYEIHWDDSSRRYSLYPLGQADKAAV